MTVRGLEPASQRRDPHTVWVLCTVARSGSSWLCELLRSSHCLGYPDEYLLDWQRRTVERGFPAGMLLEEYLSYLLRRRATRNGVFGIKGSRAELTPFLERFPHAPCVWLSRDNKLEQAISWYRAHEGGLWTHAAGGNASVARRRLEWSSERAIWFYHEVLRREAEWREFFLTRRSPPLMLTYEVVCQDPLAAVRSIATYLGVPAENIQSVHSQLRIVRDDLSADWVTRLAAAVNELETRAGARA